MIDIGLILLLELVPATCFTELGYISQVNMFTGKR